ncbi:RBR-type E3 ubiquitin transferase [Ascochyta rabiei]|uniref:RBR-type E3 ubiquitin transferase n=1 Tax=Didymella rabiei TaxID=5454 RepID=A0A162Z2F5_DIDRA|nr:RBR-type E3 ubiquitin transferase [Ascochyta rabiei]KZM20361.1 zinc ion binding [Ascochyta rabiei]UPX16511.1 RBR-type E3 ubiquitin transferase [Ascochyta rabiei]
MTRSIPERYRNLDPNPAGDIDRGSPPLPAPTTRVLRSQTKTTRRVVSPAHAAYIQSGIGKGKKTTKRRKSLDPWYPKRKVNKNPEPRAPPPKHFTCRICISHLPSSDFVRWVTSSRARFRTRLDAPVSCIPHLARNPSRRHIDPVCKACVGSFMAARLETLGVRQVSIGCLELGCTTAWPLDLVVQYLPRDKLEAFNLATFDLWRADAELFTCLSPSCTAAGFIDASAPGYPQVQCSECRFRSCAACATPWHTEQTCAEVSAAAVDAQMSDPEKETLQLMQSKDGKRCPNCHLVVEKDGGCPSMFCPSCKKYFNWDTAASAVPGTKKARPVLSGRGYWQTPGTVVCEVDRLEGKVTDVADAVMGEGALENFDRFLMDPPLGRIEADGWGHLPLPDEDDADL